MARILVHGRSVLGLTLVSVVAACGGSAFSAGGPGSGGAGGSGTGASSSGSTTTTGTATSGSTTTTSTATATQSCPATEPLEGSACSGSTPMPCTYALYPCCQDDTAACANDKWHVTAGSCQPVSCPSAVPTVGDACMCPTATICIYSVGCPGSGSVSRAACSNGKWSVGSSACPTSALTCGSATCMPGEVCVTSGTNIYGCKPSPCPTNAYDCSCLRTLCPADHPICKGTDGPYVSCM